jgi:hypothetical protein
MTKRDPRDALLVPPGRGLFLFPSILETSGLNFFGYFNSKQTTLLFKPIWRADLAEPRSLRLAKFFMDHVAADRLVLSRDSRRSPTWRITYHSGAGMRTQPLFRDPATSSLARKVAQPTFYTLRSGHGL